MRKFQLMVVFLLAINIVSCSLIKTAYNNAPEAMHWWLDGYFNFTASQSTKLKPALHTLHHWHRETQLPLYVERLQKIQSDLSQDTITASTVCETMNNTQDMMQNIQLESMTIITEIAPLLSDKQLIYFEKMLQKRALKWESEWLQDSEEAQIEARLNRTIDYAEKLYGHLNISQKKMLKQKLLSSDYQAAMSYTELLRRNEDALQIMIGLNRGNLDQNEQERLLKQGFSRLINSPNSGYQDYADQLKLNTCDMIANLHATTDTKQKEHAKAWLENFIAAFKSLALNKP